MQLIKYITDLFHTPTQSAFSTDTSTTPKVSIIVPVYNARKYLPQCIKCLRKQTLTNIEIIFVNDGSTDRSLKILQRHARKDPRIKILTQENRGSAAARNSGLRIATGKYIVFVDADDFVSLNYFQQLFKIAKLHDADIAMTTQVILREKHSSTIKHTGILNYSDITTSVQDRSNIILASGISWNKIYRREFLSQNNIWYLEINNPAEDNYFTALAVIFANKIAISHKAIYYYRVVHNSQTQKTKTNTSFAMVRVYQAIDDFIQKSGLTSSEKNTWQEIINLRKLEEYKFFVHNMDKTARENFDTYFFGIFPYLKPMGQKLKDINFFPADTKI